jgi:hypothetical protein
MSHNAFWATVDASLEELKKAKTANAVVRVLNKHFNKSSGDAFFAGSGGDGSVLSSLTSAGWTVVWYRAHYYWAAQSPEDNGGYIEYVEGDVYASRRMPKPLPAGE